MPSVLNIGTYLNIGSIVLLDSRRGRLATLRLRTQSQGCVSPVPCLNTLDCHCYSLPMFAIAIAIDCPLIVIAIACHHHCHWLPLTLPLPLPSHWELTSRVASHSHPCPLPIGLASTSLYNIALKLKTTPPMYLCADLQAVYWDGIWWCVNGHNSAYFNGHETIYCDGHGDDSITMIRPISLHMPGIWGKRMMGHFEQQYSWSEENCEMYFLHKCAISISSTNVQSVHITIFLLQMQSWQSGKYDGSLNSLHASDIIMMRIWIL